MITVPLRKHTIGPYCWCDRQAERIPGGARLYHNDSLGKALGLRPIPLAERSGKLYAVICYGNVEHVVLAREVDLVDNPAFEREED